MAVWVVTKKTEYDNPAYDDPEYEDAEYDNPRLTDFETYLFATQDLAAGVIEMMAAEKIDDGFYLEGGDRHHMTLSKEEDRDTWVTYKIERMHVFDGAADDTEEAKRIFRAFLKTLDDK